MSYRLTRSQVTASYDKDYGFDLRDNITSIVDALDGNQSQTLAYDALARL